VINTDHQLHKIKICNKHITLYSKCSHVPCIPSSC